MRNILVVFGGESVEHDISVITALQTMKAIRKTDKIIPLYIMPNGKAVTADNLDDAKTYLDFGKSVKNLKEVNFSFYQPIMYILSKNKIRQKILVDVALLCTHGHGGEDGSIQGLFELNKIPYTSCDLSSSAITMDKFLTKVVLDEKKIAVVKYEHFDIWQYKANKEEIKQRILKNVNLPCIIKPAKGGSSVGISICENEQMLEQTIEECFVYDFSLVVEKFLSGAREFCCAVCQSGGKLVTSKVEEVKKGKIFTFEEKYLMPKEKEKSEIPKKLEEKIKELARQSYLALGCGGVVRVDFLLDENKLYVNEVNSIPGSLAFNLFNIPFADMIENLIDEALQRASNKNKICYKFSSQAIKSYIDKTTSLKGAK